VALVAEVVAASTTVAAFEVGIVGGSRGSEKTTINLRATAGATDATPTPRRRRCLGGPAKKGGTSHNSQKRRKETTINLRVAAGATDATTVWHLVGWLPWKKESRPPAGAGASEDQPRRGAQATTAKKKNNNNQPAGVVAGATNTTPVWRRVGLSSRPRIEISSNPRQRRRLRGSAEKKTKTRKTKTTINLWVQWLRQHGTGHMAPVRCQATGKKIQQSTTLWRQTLLTL